VPPIEKKRRLQFVDRTRSLLPSAGEECQVDELIIGAATGEREKPTTARRSASRGAATTTASPRRPCGRSGDSSSVAMAVARGRSL